jgi:hypothetical protein
VASLGRNSDDVEVDTRTSLSRTGARNEDEVVELERELVRGACAEKLTATKRARMRSRWIIPIVGLNLIGKSLGTGEDHFHR